MPSIFQVMFLELQQESLLIGRKPNGFTQHYYTEWDDGLGSERIILFLILSISSTQVPGEEVGKEAFQLLQDHFLHDLESAPYDRFEGALREINHMVNEKEKELDLRFVPNVHVIAGAIEGDELYLSQRGEAAGYLVRKRHTSSITEDLYDPKNKEDLFQNIASGQLEVDDSLVLVTGNLIQYLTPTDFSKIFSEQSVKSAAKELKDLLHGDIDEQMALLSFEVLEKAQEPVEEPVIARVGSLEEDQKKRNRREEALNILRDWAKHKDRLDFWKFFQKMDLKKQGIALGALAVFTVVTVSGFYLLKSRQGRVDDMEAKLIVAEENVTQAATQGTFDKETADGLLTEAESLAAEVLASGYLGSRASQLLEDIEQQREYLDNVIYAEDVELVADFSSELAQGENIVGVEYYGDEAVVYTEIQAYAVALGEIGSPDSLDASDAAVASTYFDDRDLIVFLTEGNQVLEYDDGNSQFADTSDVEWSGGVAVADYSTRIYVLDTEDNQIWKYNRGNSAYGSAQAYFSEEVDLAGAVSLGIDGNIWVLMENGEIRKFFAGDEVDFVVNKAPLTGTDRAVKMLTDLDSSQIYVLDAGANKVLIYDKHTVNDNITYSSQFVFEDLKGELLDFYIDKDRGNGAGTLVLVTSQAIYEWVL